MITVAAWSKNLNQPPTALICFGSILIQHNWLCIVDIVNESKFSELNRDLFWFLFVAIFRMRNCCFLSFAHLHKNTGSEITTLEFTREDVFTFPVTAPTVGLLMPHSRLLPIGNSFWRLTSKKKFTCENIAGDLVSMLISIRGILFLILLKTAVYADKSPFFPFHVIL